MISFIQSPSCFLLFLFTPCLYARQTRLLLLPPPTAQGGPPLPTEVGSLGGFTPIVWQNNNPPEDTVYINGLTGSPTSRAVDSQQNFSPPLVDDGKRLRLTLYLNKEKEVTGSRATVVHDDDQEVKEVVQPPVQHRPPERKKRKQAKKQATERSSCSGRCSNMFSCVLHGGRPLTSRLSCPGLFDVCCSSWPEQRRQQRRPVHPKKTGRALLPLPLDSISYSSVPVSTVSPPEDKIPANTLYHSNFVDEDAEVGVCGVSRSAQSRILGGLDAGYGQFPWTAHIKIRGPGIDKECGGTLVNDRWIMTAGHCTQYCLSLPACAVEVPQHEITYKVILGEYDQFKAEVFPADNYLAIDVVRHPLYRNIMRVRDNGFVESEPRYDLALLMLDRPVKLAPNVAPICLLQPNSDVLQEKLGTVVGWGRVGRDEGAPHSHVLQAATVPILSDDECLAETGLGNFDDQLCAGGSEADSSACPGDSGGALQVQDDAGRWVIVGVVSNGPSVCGLQPVVFHRLENTIDWVNNVMERQEGNGAVVNEVP